MPIDVRRAIRHLLAATATTGTFVSAVGCSCPDAPASTVQGPSAELEAFLDPLLAARNDAWCAHLCAPPDTGTTVSTGTSVSTGSTADTGAVPADVWSCAYEAANAFEPIEVTCSAEGTEPFVLPLVDDLGLPVMRILVLDASQCDSVCASGGDVDCQLEGTTSSDASVECNYYQTCIAGRRPQAGVDARTHGPDVGAWWAAMAQLEAASVPAFAELARDLQFHGAPADLVARALAAAEDERVHTRLCRERAHAYGVASQELRLAVGPPVDLQTLARHNASEGCVRETFAALEAGFQAAHAADPGDRLALERIHHDEVRHAQLAWDIHEWACQVLGPELDDHLRLAFAAFGEEVRQAEACGPLQRDLGLPAPGQRSTLLDGLEGLLAA